MFFGSYETNEITNMVVSATGHKAQQNIETGSKDKQAHPHDMEYQYIARAYVDGKWTTMTKSDIVTINTNAE